MRLTALLALVTMALPVLAEHPHPKPTRWRSLEGMNTADLSAAGWRQVGAIVEPEQSKHSWSFWSFWEGELDGARVTVRCRTSLHNDSRPLLDVCEQPDEPAGPGMSVVIQGRDVNVRVIGEE